MSLAITLLTLISLILLGAVAPKPNGWIVVTLSVIALLLVVLGGFHVGIGR